MISKLPCLITRFPTANYDKQTVKNSLRNSMATVRHNIYFANTLRIEFGSLNINKLERIQPQTGRFITGGLKYAQQPGTAV